MHPTHGEDDPRSDLLGKVSGLGLELPDDLERIAVVRGLRYYDVRNEGDRLRRETRLRISTDRLSNAELAIAMLSPDLPAETPARLQLRQRIAAAVLSAPDVEPRNLAELAVRARCAPIVRWIALCGEEVEPENAFWRELLAALPDVENPERAPHPTRFVEMTGITRNHVGIQKRWIHLVT